MKRLRKALKDIISILYDGDGYMSLPRVGSVVMTVVIIIAWISIQYQGKSFEYFRELCVFAAVPWGSYGWKKSTEEKGKKDG